MPINLEEWQTHYGFSPQVYLEKVAVGQALAPKLAAEEAKLAELKAKHNSNWEQLPEAEWPAAVDIENEYLAQVSHVNGLQVRRDAAIQYANHEISWGGFRSYLGDTAQAIIDDLGADEEAIRIAIERAIAPVTE